MQPNYYVILRTPTNYSFCCICFRDVLREAAKKKVPPLVAGPLRGGWGKGRATKEKRTFFLFCCHLKIKIILL